MVEVGIDSWTDQMLQRPFCKLDKLTLTYTAPATKKKDDCNEANIITYVKMQKP